VQADRPVLHPALLQRLDRCSLGIRCWKPGRDFGQQKILKIIFVEIRIAQFVHQRYCNSKNR